MQEYLSIVPNLEIYGGAAYEVTDLLVERGKTQGVKLKDGSELRARVVVITSGTFLRAIMHTGFDRKEGGRVEDPSANFLSSALENAGFRLRRLKTGTPPRLHRQSIDFSKAEPQPGDLE